MWEWIKDLNFGDVPTWIAAVVTSGALWLTARTASRDQADRRARDEDAQAEQARNIMVSPVTVKVGYSSQAQEFETLIADMKVSNFTLNAIHDVTVRLYVDPPSAVHTNPDTTETRDVLAPTEDFEVQLATQILRDRSEGRRFEVAFRQVTTFTDIAGRKWRRDADYRLARI